WVSLRAAAFPLDTICCNSARSSSVRVTRYLSIAVVLISGYRHVATVKNQGTAFTCQMKMDGPLVSTVGVVAEARGRAIWERSDKIGLSPKRQASRGPSMPDSPSGARSFWIEAFTWRGAVSRRVLPTTLAFSAFATIVYLLHYYLSNYYHKEINLAVEVGPHEIAGALLGLLLVMRTSAGYDRWWEARKLWGGIINESRNLVLTALAHGPAEGRWRESIVHWTIAFAYATKARLRGDGEVAELRLLLGEEQAKRVRAAEHVPFRIALKISELLREGCERGMDRFAFVQA